MTISLYDASIASFLQSLDATSGFLAKGLDHCRANGIGPDEIVEARLFADMRPFRFQIHSILLHSQGAVDAIRSGVLDLPGERPAHDYPALQALVADASHALRQLSPDEINERQGANVVFRARGTERVFTAEAFLLSFALPNFYFHTTTAYNILRSRGVPVGKLDYMGSLRLKT